MLATIVILTVALVTKTHAFLAWAIVFEYHIILWYLASNYQRRSAVILDQTLNMELFNGMPDETISVRAAFAKQRGKLWGRLLCWFLDKIDPGHCERELTDYLTCATHRRLE